MKKLFKTLMILLFSADIVIITVISYLYYDYNTTQPIESDFVIEHTLKGFKVSRKIN